VDDPYREPGDLPSNRSAVDQTRPYELAVAHLLADIRRQRASQECIRIAMAACRRYLTESAILDAAAGDQDPGKFVTAATIRSITDLENEFNTGPDDPVWQAAEVLKRLVGARTRS